MFTGIIQAIGHVLKYDDKRLWIGCSFRGIRLGESMSVDGVCLTVAARKGHRLAFDVGSTTQRVTTLGGLKSGSRVNLERALRVGDRLGGHWVSGHVEEMGRLVNVTKARQSCLYTFELPKDSLRYVVPKGSISLDGISLTVAEIRGRAIDVMIIPRTLSHTTLGNKKIGDRVNVEADLLAKYALHQKEIF
jgi:riboflavin synthase